jgi:hypothetical protein
MVLSRKVSDQQPFLILHRQIFHYYDNSTSIHYQQLLSFRHANFTPISDQLIHVNAMATVLRIDANVRKMVESVVPNAMVVMD